MRSIACVACVGILVSACLTDNRPSRARGGSGDFFNPVPQIAAPKEDRCQGFGKTAVRARCDEARYLASNYVRALSTGDSVCLEGGFGEEAGAACQARAAVADVDQERILIEIRAAQPQSRWNKYVQHQIWFEEGALVDLYLAERGY